MDEMKIMPDDKLKAELRSLNAKENVATKLMFISAAGIFLFAFLNLLPVTLICFLLTIVFMSKALKLRDKKKKLLSENVISVVLKGALGDDVDYRPWEKITPGSMMVPFSYCDEDGSQHIKAVYNGMNIELGNITLFNKEEVSDGEGGTDTKSVPQFIGQWLICNFGKELPCDVFISEISKDDRNSMTNNVTIDNRQFGKRFCVKADDPQAAYSILTPQMMKYISVMADKSGCPVYLSFLRSGKLHIAVKTGRELFELDKADVEALRRKFLSELHGMLDIIDTLHPEEINV